MNTQQSIRLGTDKLKSFNKYNKKSFVINKNLFIFVKITIMRKFLLVLFCFGWVISYSQSIELKTYCLGNPNHDLINKLSPTSRLELQKILVQNNVDTSTFYRVKYNEIFTLYTSKNYLSDHSYKYYNWSQINGNYKIREYSKLDGYFTNKPDKLIVLYSTNEGNIETLSVYILN